MGLLMFIIIALAIFFLWNQNKKAGKNTASDTLAKLDVFGQVKGKCIEDLQSILGKPCLRTSIDSQIVQFTWNVGTVTVVACWNKMADEEIVSFYRSDRV